MEKLKMHSPDLTQTNIDKIAQLFPTVVTESLAEDGRPVRAIDFDLLRQELSDHVVDGPQERYRLDWPGKREALFAANAPIAKTLRPVRDESVNFDTTKNLFIEGDNLDALKLLQKSYLERVDLIYIDPPYNTGGDQFVYPDNYAQDNEGYLRKSGQIDEQGTRLISNLDSNGRFHSDWLSMVYPRLKLARNLLSQRGLAIISIDENEVANLLRICEEIFGPRNVLGALPVVMNLKGNQDAFGFAETHEFVVVCLRDRAHAVVNGFDVDEESLLSDWEEDEYGLFKEADNLRATGVNAPREKRPNLWYPIFLDMESREAYVTADDTPRALNHETIWPVNPDGDELSWYWSKKKFIAESHNLILKNTKNGYQFYKKQRPELGEAPSKKAKSFFYKPSYSTSTATKQLKNLMGGRFFAAPKPVPFLEDLITLGTKSDSIVLDFFAGSGSTAQAVMQVNERDGGERSFVLVQLTEEFPEHSEARRSGYGTIPEFTRERLKRSAKDVRLKSEVSGWSGDTGFRYLIVDSTGMAVTTRQPDLTDQDALALFTDNVKTDRSDEDLLLEVLLDWGLGVDTRIGVEDLGPHQVFTVEDGALVACFGVAVGDELVRAIAERQPLGAVFRDSSFASDAERINAEQIFSEASPHTDVKVI